MNFKFQLTAEGDARLVSASGEDGVAVIPDVWEGHPVTVIGEEAFYGNHNLHRVRLPKHLKKNRGPRFCRMSFSGAGGLSGGNEKCWGLLFL